MARAGCDQSFAWMALKGMKLRILSPELPIIAPESDPTRLPPCPLTLGDFGLSPDFGYLPLNQKNPTRARLPGKEAGNTILWVFYV